MSIEKFGSRFVACFCWGLAAIDPMMLAPKSEALEDQDVVVAETRTIHVTFPFVNLQHTIILILQLMASIFTKFDGLLRIYEL